MGNTEGKSLAAWAVYKHDAPGTQDWVCVCEDKDWGTVWYWMLHSRVARLRQMEIKQRNKQKKGYVTMVNSYSTG